MLQSQLATTSGFPRLASYSVEHSETGRYQRLAGKLIHLAHTRPNIAFYVSVMSQFMHAPYEEHLEAVHKILRRNS